MGLPSCLFVCLLILLLVCFLFNCKNFFWELLHISGSMTMRQPLFLFQEIVNMRCALLFYLLGSITKRQAVFYISESMTMRISCVLFYYHKKLEGLCLLSGHSMWSSLRSVLSFINQIFCIVKLGNSVRYWY